MKVFLKSLYFLFCQISFCQSYVCQPCDNQMQWMFGQQCPKGDFFCSKIFVDRMVCIGVFQHISLNKLTWWDNFEVLWHSLSTIVSTTSLIWSKPKIYNFWRSRKWYPDALDWGFLFVLITSWLRRMCYTLVALLFESGYFQIFYNTLI